MPAPDPEATAPKVRHEIVGTVTLYHSNQLPGRENEEKRCICCPGFDSHIYGIELRLGDYPSIFPKHFGKRLDYWLQSMLDFKGLEGRRIRIMAELLPDEGTAVEGAVTDAE